VQTAFRATIAQRLPFLLGHLGQWFFAPEGRFHEFGDTADGFGRSILVAKWFREFGKELFGAAAVHGVAFTCFGRFGLDRLTTRSFGS
jgi:hypothetical protein